MIVAIATGGFDPVHSGHIDYLNRAKNVADYLVVGLNSDEWLTRKKGKPFMPFSERFSVISNLKAVDWVLAIDDADDTALDAIYQSRAMFPTARLIFANGGDRTKENIPEMSSGDTNIEFMFGVGGENKKNSSRWILENWNKN